MIGAAIALFATALQASDCAACHKSEAARQVRTPMAHALQLARDCAILKEHPKPGLPLRYLFLRHRAARRPQRLHRHGRQGNDRGRSAMGLRARGRGPDLCVPARRLLLRKPRQLFRRLERSRPHHGSCQRAPTHHRRSRRPQDGLRRRPRLFQLPCHRGASRKGSRHRHSNAWSAVRKMPRPRRQLMLRGCAQAMPRTAQ